METKTGSIEILQQIRKPYSSKSNVNGKFYQYKCCKDGYIGVIYESSLLKKTGCCVCGKSRLVQGFNDICTVKPEKVNFFYNPEDATKYTLQSNSYADFKCELCGVKIANKPISTVMKKEHIYCPMCDTNTCSFGERLMWSLLYTYNINFRHDCAFDWSNGKRYDFYLPEYDIIIEMHGQQHYNKAFPKGKNIKEQQENDLFKFQLACQNGINKYYQIDCKESDFYQTVNRIKDVDLLQVLHIENVEWDKIEKLSANSIDQQCLALWNGGLKSTIKIGEKLSIHCSTVRRILKKYSKMKMCDYNPETARIHKDSQDINYTNTKAVICLNNLYIFKRMSYATKWCGSKKIYKNCKGITLSAGKHPDTDEKLHWAYLDDYLQEHPEIIDLNLFVEQHLYVFE